MLQRHYSKSVFKIRDKSGERSIYVQHQATSEQTYTERLNGQEGSTQAQTPCSVKNLVKGWCSNHISTLVALIPGLACVQQSCSQTHACTSCKYSKKFL